MSKLKYNPMDSLELNKNFEAQPVQNPEQIQEYLTSMGIHPDFIKPLNIMFEGIKATTAEIINTGPDLIVANNRINKKEELLSAKGKQRIHRTLVT